MVLTIGGGACGLSKVPFKPSIIAAETFMAALLLAKRTELYGNHTLNKRVNRI